MRSRASKCGPNEHRTPREAKLVSAETLDRAAAIFRALGDPGRLRILEMLLSGPMCVSAISQELRDSMPAVSQRLKLLRSERLLSHRREGKHVIYSLADQHISRLVKNGLAHASEAEERAVSKKVSGLTS